MSRRRKPNSRRRPARSQGTRTNGARRSLTKNSESPSADVVVSNRTKLNPRSCVFVGPEEAVTTFEVEHPAALGRRSGGRAPRDATIIKGCPSRYALENCGTLQMGTLAYYRKHGDSLIWDMKEGVIAGDERIDVRRDDPADLVAYEQTDIELSVGHPLGRALGAHTIKRLNVNESSQASLLLGENCLIWCASLEPQGTKEWDLWGDSLEPLYDHTTYLGDPAPFARTLAMMASSERSRLGSYLDLRNPDTGHVEQCNNLAVLYGPVVYLDDPRDYILKSDDEMELIVRSIFTKTTEHRHQREYRFAILSQHGLDRDTVHLQVPPTIRQALHASSGRNAVQPHLPEAGPAVSMPSPRLLRCFVRDTTRGVADCRHGLPRNVNIRLRLRLSGTHHKSSTTRKAAVMSVAAVNREAIEDAIRAEPRVTNDARIAKLIIDGGPGTVTHVYCFEGIWGQIRFKAVSGGASLNVQASHPGNTSIILCNNFGFDGQFKLSHSAQQLILTVVPMNPAATVEIDHPCRNPDLPQNHVTLSPTEDTQVTVTATSEDGTQTSSCTVVIDRALCPTNQSEAA